MKKGFKLWMVLALTASLLGCASKTKFDPVTVNFISAYLGEESGFSAANTLSLNSSESSGFKAALNVQLWKSIDSIDKKKLTESGLILIDNDQNTLTFYQVDALIIIKVKAAKTDPIYYQFTGNLSTILKDDLVTLVHALRIKHTVESLYFNLAEPDTVNMTQFSAVSMTSADSDALKVALDIDSWIMVDKDLPQRPAMDLLIKSSTPDYEIQAKADASSNTALITVHHHYGKLALYDTFSISKSQFDKIQNVLIAVETAVQVHPSESIKTAAFSDVKVFAMSNDPITSFSLTESESNSAKVSMQMDRWVKISNAVSLLNRQLVLTDTKGLVFTLGPSDLGPIAVITSTKEPAFKEVYGLPDYVDLISMAFLAYDASFLPSDAMLHFTPVKLIIIESWSEETAEVISRTYALNESVSAELKTILDLTHWTKDPDPTSYGRGWYYGFSLVDEVGRSLDFYGMLNHYSLIHINGFIPDTQEWVWYDASAKVITDLNAYITAHYPKP